MRWLLVLCLSLGAWAQNHSLVSGDFDGDGKPDLILGRTHDFLVFRNLGDGSFAPPVTRDGSPGYDSPQCFVGKLDGDGRDDLVVVRAGKATAWSGAELPIWTAEPAAVKWVTWLAGRLLLASGGTLRSYQLKPDGGLGGYNQRTYPAEIWSVTTVAEQALAVSLCPDQEAFFVYAASDSFKQARTLHLGSDAGLVVGGDFNGDGRIEWAGLLHPCLRLWDQGRVRVYPAESISAFEAEVGDFTGDGLPDLLTPTVYGATLFAGERRRGLAPGRTVGSAYLLAAGDWDGDGRRDFVGSDYDGQILRLYFNQGDSHFMVRELKW